MQPLQLRRDLGSDDVGPGREKLAELDVGGAQPVDRAGEDGEAGDVAPRQEVRGRQRGPGERRQRAQVDADEGAFPRQHESGAGEPQDVSDRRRDRQFQSFQPE